MIGLLFLSLQYLLLSVDGQNFSHSSTTDTTTFVNNSFIDRGVISVDNPLICQTNYTPCCLGNQGGWWDPAGTAVQEGSTGATTFYVSRASSGGILLHRHADGTQLSGMYQCRIPDSTGTIVSLYIYLGVADTGQLSSAVVTFTELLTQPNATTPIFMLTCSSGGGPATTVQWRRNGVAIINNTTYDSSLILTNTGENTMYESRLRVTGRQVGQYDCIVSNNRNSYFGGGHTISSSALTISAAGEPTRVNAVDLLSEGNILVTWTPPSGSVSGYTIYLQPVGLVQNLGATAVEHMFQDLEDGDDYEVFLVALSNQLPSVVIGPISPSTLPPPNVSLSYTPTTPSAGNMMTLSCSVDIPTDIVIHGVPEIFFNGPSGSPEAGPHTAVAMETLQDTNQFTATHMFTSLSLRSNGTYSCGSTYSINGATSTSPEGSATTPISVTFSLTTPSLMLSSDTPVAYVSGTVILECAVFVVQLNTNDLVAQFTWTKDGSSLPPSANIGAPSASGPLIRSRVTISGVQMSDGGEYLCRVRVEASNGNIIPATVQSSVLDLAVSSPVVSVATNPETQRILDISNYNTFTIICTASAVADSFSIPLSHLVWERKGNNEVDFSSVSSDIYSPLSGDSNTGYSSTLNGTESEASTTVVYRCTAGLTDTSSFISSSTTTITVQGPTTPTEVVPRVVDFRDTQVTIQWVVDSIAYTPETYDVIYGTVSNMLDRTSVQQRSSGSDISITGVTYSLPLSDLTPLTAYYFQLRANNSVGSTLSDIQNFNTTARRPNPPVELSQATGSQPRSYVFSWEASPPSIGTPPISAYTLTCTAPQGAELTVSDSIPNDAILSATLVLYDGVSYNCCVQAVSDGVAPSDERCLNSLLVTPAQVPGGPPLSLEVIATARNLSFTWSPPELTVRNGDISSYTISCSSSSSPSSSFTTSTPNTGHIATDLPPFTNFSCSVFATNSAGDGPPAPVTTSTNEDRPDASPQSFDYTLTDGNITVSFSWSPPPPPSRNGEIVSYLVLCNNTESSPTTMLSTSIDLTPDTTFSCRVSASTSVGYGPNSDPLIFLTVPGKPEGVEVMEGRDGLQVTWQEEDEKSSVTGYRIQVLNINRDIPYSEKTDVPEILLRSTVYGGFERINVRIAAVNKAGVGPFTDPVFATTPSIPPGQCSIIDVTVNEGELTIQWNQPEYPNGILSGYVVLIFPFKMNEPNTREILDNTTFTFSHDVSSLDPGVPYNVVLAAVNERGRGENVSQTFFSMETKSKPVIISENDRSREENGDLTISWTKPSLVDARGIISQYEIRYSEYEGGDGGGGGGERRKRQEECPVDRCVLAEREKSGCCRVSENTTSVTISGLNPTREYVVSVGAVNGAGVGEIDSFVVKPAVTDDSEPFPVAIVIGVVLGILVVALLVVTIVIIFLLIRYRRNKAVPLDGRSIGGIEEMVSLSAVNPKTASPNPPPSSSPILTTPEQRARMKVIELDKFPEHVRQMHDDRDRGFEQEYQTFITQPEKPQEAAKDTKNKNKNRFANIMPYDENRVRLQEVDGVEGSDYINASFIHGYSRSDAYIAAQGPMAGTILDFWRMIWEHRPTTMVMLTKQIEGGKRKCEVYWPEKLGETLNAGCGIIVKYTELIPFADFEIKKFTITNTKKPKVPELNVQHFQFLSWPDHGVPKFATALISFIRRLRQYHNPQSAMLVHCSAGVGRTGAFILLDSMLERIASENSVNVYEFLTKMRRQRIHLVQTLAQYVFVHDALEELIICGDTAIKAPNLRSTIRDMKEVVPGNKTVTGFTQQFKLLQKVSRKPSDTDNSDALEQYNRDKNRYQSCVPYNMNRVRLKPTGLTGGEYINASFLDGYKMKNAYMAAQAPLASTVNDFWRMIWEFKSRAIVMLCQQTENGKEVSYCYWPTQPGAKQMYGKNTVTLVSEEYPFGAKEIVVRKFEISGDKNTAAFTVTQYHVVSWPEEGEMMESGLLIQLVSELNKLQRSTENKPITVVCNDGMGRTGTFVTIHAMLEKVNSEHIVDIFQFIKSSRINRPDIVREEEHYIFCHEAVADYLDSFQTYANFKA